MQEQRFTRADWVLFRKKLPGWQEAYMDKLNQEYIVLLTGEGSPSDKFWELYKRIREDKRGPGVLLRISRTDFICNLIALINDGVISMKDLEDFSDNLRDTISAFLDRSHWDFTDEE